MSSIFTNDESATFATAGPDPRPALASPTPSMVDPQAGETSAQKAKRLGLLRMGLASTITGAGQNQPTDASMVSTPALSSPGYSPGTKTLLGQ